MIRTRFFATHRSVLCTFFIALSACGGPDTRDNPGACATGQDFEGIDFSGLWHFETRFDDLGVGVNPMIVTSDANGAYQATVYGVPATELTMDRTGMHVFMIVSQGPDVATRTREYDICTRDADGTVHGRYEFCIDVECHPADLTGHKVEPLDEPVAQGVLEISEYNGPAGAWAQQGITVNVRVDQDMAYVARYQDGLRIVDISDPSAPVELGHAITTSGAERYNDVKVARGPTGQVYALMASNIRGVVVIDVTEPSAPVEVLTFPDPGLELDGWPSVHTLFVDQGLAYVSYNYDESMRIYDISDPAQPLALGSYANPRLSFEPGVLHDLYVGQGVAYLDYWNLGMSIVDVSDPMRPVLLGEYRDYGGTTSHSNWVVDVAGRTVSVHGDEQYGAHVRVVDVDPASPDFLSTLAEYQTRPEVSVHNIMARGERAYITYYQDGLRVLDLQDPENPVEIAHYNTWPGLSPGYGGSFYEGAIGLDLDPGSDTVYLADTHRGIFILEVP